MLVRGGACMHTCLHASLDDHLVAVVVASMYQPRHRLELPSKRQQYRECGSAAARGFALCSLWNVSPCLEMVLPVMADLLRRERQALEQQARQGGATEVHALNSCKGTRKPAKEIDRVWLGGWLGGWVADWLTGWVADWLTG